MTRAEHYREAEKLLNGLGNVEHGSPAEPGILAEAQVHATLALAAASAQNIRRNGAIERDVADWHEAIGGGS